VQFGLNGVLLGVADRRLDAACPALGIACVPPEGPWTGEGADPAALLREQEGLYTLLVRGYRGETPVKDEVVVQSILCVADDPQEPAVNPALALGLLDTEAPDFDANAVNAAKLLSLRFEAGLNGLYMLCLGEDADCTHRAREAIAALTPDPAFRKWLCDSCAFCPALADGLAFRADAKAAARQCAEMNYADGMLHLAEPYAHMTIQAPVRLREVLPVRDGGGISIVDDLVPALNDKRRAFDAGLFAMAAPGWLLGCNTLSDCMKHERLRDFVGRCYADELLPADPDARAAIAPRVIQAFERFENPLNENALLPTARPLLMRFRRAVLPIMRAWADENYEPPRLLSFALAATIMLYAGARSNAEGRYEVYRGTQVFTLEDDPEALAVFATLSHDMPPEALAYAALADRELWHGEDLRDIDGLEARVALDIANLQRKPDYLPE
jgi:tagaturonate reductase